MGQRASPTCRWPTATGSYPVGPTSAPFRTWSANRCWAGRWGRPCRKNWSPRPYNAPFGLSRLPQAWWSTRTAGDNIAVTPTALCSTTTRPCARRAAAVVPGRATATITRKPKACGRASKRRCSKDASGPFLPTSRTRRPASPTILTTTITSAYTPVLITRRRILLINNFFNLTP